MGQRVTFEDNALENQSGDDENRPLLETKKLRYPKSVFFIVVNEFCERFNYYGLRAILWVYLTQKLRYSEDSSTVIFHLSAMGVYLCSLFGAVIADSWWGKFKTILVLSCVYAIGSTTVAAGSVDHWRLPSREFTLFGLALIAIGSGGIKPCVSAFGGEQFKLPEQEKDLKNFFSLFYFTINVGSAFTTIITPEIKSHRCFGMRECYVGGFGLPAVLMVLAIIIFVLGQSKYVKVPPQGNMVVKFSKCIWSAITNKFRGNTLNPGWHWLDYAEEKHGYKLVSDCKALLNIIVIYLPLPLFWALFDQQGSRWVEQAYKLDGNYSSFTIKPEQMQAANPFFILLLIPLCEFVIYPFLALLGIQRSLQKMSLGGILAAVAFLCSMFLEMKIEASEPNTIGLLWQLPQITIITLAEVMFSITGLEFAFVQAPESMKSVVQAFWMLTVACGDLIVALVVQSHALENQAMEFLLFAGLMFVDMIIFMILAYRFKPTTSTV